MTDATFGELTETEGVRDAIHVAAISVRAEERLNPGQKVFVADGVARKKGEGQASSGIVDPFLAAPVQAGQIFWLFLRPGTITGLRHVWTHPDFPSEEIGWKDIIDLDKELVVELAEIIGFTYDRLMDDYRRYIEYDDYAYDNSERYKDAGSNYWEALARHYKRLNPNVEIDDRYGAPVPYTCAC